MSKLTIDEAILHCEEQIKQQKQNNCCACMQDHIQLKDWLIELKQYRELISKYKKDMVH